MNTKLIKFILLTLLLNSFVFCWVALQHPVKNVRVTSKFGESRGDHYHTGTDYADQQLIFPVDEGEILFAIDFSKDPTQPIMGSGNMVVIEHAEQYRSYYFHLRNGSIDTTRTKADPFRPIGFMGDTGHSIGNHLHFVVTRPGLFLDPLAHLPVIEDKEKPSIHRLLFVIGDKPALTIANKSVINYRGEIKIFVIAWDKKMGLGPRVPFALGTTTGVARLQLLVDNVLVRDYNFRQLSTVSSDVLVSGKYTIDDVYGRPFNYKFGTFVPSKKTHVFRVECEDLAGNFDTKEYTVNFL